MQSSEKNVVINSTKGSGQVEKQDYNTVTTIDNTKNVDLHTYKSSFTTVKSLVGRLKRLIEFVGFQVVLMT